MWLIFPLPCIHYTGTASILTHFTDEKCATKHTAYSAQICTSMLLIRKGMICKINHVGKLHYILCLSWGFPGPFNDTFYIASSFIQQKLIQNAEAVCRRNLSSPSLLSWELKGSVAASSDAIHELVSRNVCQTFARSGTFRYVLMQHWGAKIWSVILQKLVLPSELVEL